MKLNVGSSEPKGRYKRAPWINIDRQTKSNVTRFARADALNLPFKASSIEEIHCIHMMEHIHRDLNIPLIREFHRVLQPGGVALIEIPDFMETFKQIVVLEQFLLEKRSDRQRIVAAEKLRCLRLSVYGKGRHEDDFHLWSIMRSDVKRYADECGFLYAEQEEMISSHHTQEPVVLFALRKPC